MNHPAIRLSILFVLLVIVQAVVFNHLCLFGVAFPLVFIYFVISMPVTWSDTLALTCSFALGLVIDIFSDTPGMNALACTLLCAFRKPILRLYFPREEDMTNPEPSIRTLGFETYSKYLITMCLLYCTLYFLIEAFSFFNFWRLLTRILASSIFTFLLILGIDSLSMRNNAKRL